MAKNQLPTKGTASSQEKNSGWNVVVDKGNGKRENSVI